METTEKEEKGSIRAGNNPSARKGQGFLSPSDEVQIPLSSSVTLRKSLNLSESIFIHSRIPTSWGYSEDLMGSFT